MTTTISYGLRITETPEARAWFATVSRRLRDRQGLVFGGRIRRVKDGLYVVGLELYVSPWALVIGPILCVVAGLAAWILWQSVGWSNWLTGIGAVGLVLTYVLLLPVAHRFVMSFTLWRVTKRYEWVKPATEEVLYLVATGEVAPNGTA